MKKTRSKKSRDTVPLKVLAHCSAFFLIPHTLLSIFVVFSKLMCLLYFFPLSQFYGAECHIYRQPIPRGQYPVMCRSYCFSSCSLRNNLLETNRAIMSHTFLRAKVMEKRLYLIYISIICCPFRKTLVVALC